jgi:hypothetical protein
MPLETEIPAYDARLDELKLHHNGKWVVFMKRNSWGHSIPSITPRARQCAASVEVRI